MPPRRGLCVVVLQLLQLLSRGARGCNTGRGGGKLACAGEGVVGAPIPDPPFLGSRDGALKKVIDGGK